jgi:hypothetical protein
MIYFCFLNSDKSRSGQGFWVSGTRNLIIREVEFAKIRDYEITILDLLLPDVDGYKVLLQVMLPQCQLLYLLATARLAVVSESGVPSTCSNLGQASTVLLPH